MSDEIKNPVVAEEIVIPVGTVAEVVAEVVKEPSFIDSLPEDLRKENALATFKDSAALAKSYLEVQKLMGKKVTDLSAEELAIINKKLDLPVGLEDYDFEAEEDLKAKALELKIPKTQLKAISELISDKKAAKDAAELAELESKLKADQAALKEMYGMDLDSKKDLAKKAMAEFGSEDFAKVITDAGLGSNPHVIKMLSQVGQLFEEGKVFQSKQKVEPSSVEAKSILKERMSDPDFKKAYLAATHPRHKEVLAEVIRLQRLSHS